jgi:hypothetical protein
VISAWERAISAHEAAVAAVDVCERAPDDACSERALEVVEAARLAAQAAAEAWTAAQAEIERAP